jgi:hypothetical protein
MRLFVFAILTCALIACSSSTGPQSHTFVMRIDSIGAPAVVDDTGRMEIHLYVNPSAPGGCPSFAYFRSSQSRDSLDLTAFGHVTNSDRLPVALCLGFPNELVFVATPPFFGPFKVVVREPDGTTIHREVQISSPLMVQSGS